jgi:hypothetical protein
VYIVKAYVGLEVELHPFLTWMEVRGQFHELGTLPSRKELLASLEQETWWGPQPILRFCIRKEILSLPGIKQ